MNNLKIGVLGAGHLGKIHLKLLSETEGYDLVGFYDPDPEQVEYAKLDVAERISTAISSAITTIVVLQLVFFVCGFLSIGLGIYLGQQMDSYVKGFLTVGGIYAILTVAIVIFRRPLVTNPVVSRIIKIFFEVK